jgi:uncharacterized protein
MSKIIYIPFNTVPYNSVLDILKKEFSNYISDWNISNESVAIKIHLGEKGAIRFIRPIYVRPIVDCIKELNGIPYLTDTTTLYKGPREISPTCIEVALKHGFSYTSVNCPIIIADGLNGTDEVSVKYNNREYFVASSIFNTDYYIIITHVTMHGFTGLGSVVKNIGMGLTSKKGKTEIHKKTIPNVNKNNCKSCGKCLVRCSHDALVLNDTIELLRDKCVGCCHCIGVCLDNVFNIPNDALIKFCNKLSEYAKAIVDNKKVIYVNFLMEIAPQCDCASFTHKPLCGDIGILISDNIVDIELLTLQLIEKNIKIDPFVKELFLAQLSHFDNNISINKIIDLTEVVS